MSKSDFDPEDPDQLGLARYIGLVIAVAVIVIAVLYDFHWWGTFDHLR